MSKRLADKPPHAESQRHYQLLKYRKFNFIALPGLISVLLTGGIGLLQLDPQWLAVKEAAPRPAVMYEPIQGRFGFYV